MKKLIATLLAVGLVATLGACGAKKDDTTLKVAATRRAPRRNSQRLQGYDEREGLHLGSHRVQ